MPITVHPHAGQILMCDFSQGFKEPEMVKKRPVVVLTPVIPGRAKLVTVVALSTKAPEPVQPFHFRLGKQFLPQVGFFQEEESWVKGDMIYAVAFHRLDLIQLGKKHPVTGKRLYFSRLIPFDQMKEIRKCVLHGLSLGALCQHL